MTAIISKALRDEVVESARRLLPKATADLEQMYRSHAERHLRRQLRPYEEARIKKHVSDMLSISPPPRREDE